LREQYRLLSSSLCCFLRSSVTSSLLGPYILLNTLSSNTVRSSRIAGDQVTHSYTDRTDFIFYCFDYISCTWLRGFKSPWIEQDNVT
jgi:hypothetical protein